MFKIESLLSKHLVSVLGVLVAAFTLIANVGCAGVTAAPNSNSRVFGFGPGHTVYS